MTKNSLPYVLIGTVAVAAVSYVIYRTVSKARRKSRWLDSLVSLNGKPLTEQQRTNAIEILNTWETYGDGDERKLAYILATAWHESQRLTKLTETGSGGGRYIRNGLSYHGRGFVHITWWYNYDKFTEIVKIDLLRNPSAAARPDVAAKIIVIGMLYGMFRSGQTLERYINAKTTNYVGAREIVNPDGEGSRISNYAKQLWNFSKNINTSSLAPFA